MKKIIILIFALICNFALAQESHQVHYIKRCMDAYQILIEAGKPIETKQKSKNDPEWLRITSMLSLMTQRNAAHIARDIFAEFADDENLMIRTSANLMNAAILTLELELSNSADVVRDSLSLSMPDNNFNSSLKKAQEISRRLQEAKAKTHDAWVLYMKTSVINTYVLIDDPDFDKTNPADPLKKLQRLNITKKERDEIRRILKMRFGKIIAEYDGSKNVSAAEAPPVFIYKFLNDAWKSSDEN